MGLSLQKVTDRHYVVLIDGELKGDFWRLEPDGRWIFYTERALGLFHWELREISEMLSQMEGFVESKS